MNFDKEKFLSDFDCILSSEYACDAKGAGVKELYNAVSKAVMAGLAEEWRKSAAKHEKRCGYLSAEFLVGRAIYSNLLNLGILEEVKDALSSRGLRLEAFEEVEDAALGNGGLGRLAACFLESAATHGIPLDGYGLRYRRGFFRQTFRDGFQREEADEWLDWGDPWSVRRERDEVRVDFADLSVRAVPYDMPVVGYRSGTTNNLRLWQSEPLRSFDFAAFDRMRGSETAEQNFRAEEITAVLYPNDNTPEGKLLRLRQQYFMVSASLQDLLRTQKREGRDLTKLGNYLSLQLNDTHPVLAIPELIRLLKKEGASFETAFDVCRRVFCFTNHTVMGEALERWRGETLRQILPDLWTIIEEIQSRLEREGTDDGALFIIKDDVAYMANLAVYVSRIVNGVAEIHTGILKADTFREWYRRYPEKFVNVTNGITPRRWFLLNNPNMAAEITARIGRAWETDLSRISEIGEYLSDPDFRAAFSAVKRENKRRLSAYIARRDGAAIDENFIFDVQVKRLHEYKRQLMNALSVLYLYNELKEGNLPDFKPTAFLFGAKAAPGYYNAKAIVKFINEIAAKIDADGSVKDKLKVVFVQNYDVSYAEKIVCAADVSEQISMAGMEASGTGNMKFMLNGTVTLGTMDGANVEICEEAGRENNYIFGASAEEAKRVKRNYDPNAILARNPPLKRAVESLVDGSFSDGGTGVLKAIYDSLLLGKEPDRYLVLYDFESYLAAKLRLNRDYGSEEFLTKCLVNMASAGKFSADRSVREYAEKIWNLSSD